MDDPTQPEKVKKEYISPRLTDLGSGEAAAEEVRRKAQERGLSGDEIERLFEELRLKPKYLTLVT
jgi:hypothetical protein